MFYLIGQILFCLLVAMIIGFILGYLFKQWQDETIMVDLRKQLDDLRAQLAAAQKERDDVKTALTELEAEHKRCADVETRLAALQATHARCGDAVGRAEKLQADLDALRGSSSDLRAQIVTLTSQRDEVTGRLSALTTQHDALASEHARKDSESGDAAAAAAAAAATAAAAAAALKIKNLGDDLEAARAELATLKTANGDGAAELEALRRSQREAIASRDSLAQSVEEYEATLSANSRRIGELEAALKDCQEKKQEAPPAAEPAKADDTSAAEIASLTSENDRLRVALEGAVTQLVELGHGTKPVGLFTSRPSKVDDLKRIKGVGPVMEKTLNDLGIYCFFQVAALSPTEVSWVSSNINAFPGRIVRDQWVRQAIDFAKEPETAKPA